MTTTTDQTANPPINRAEGQDGQTDQHGSDTAVLGQDATGQQQEPETFPRAYVEQLRQESAGYRTRAQQADTLAQRLHTTLVAGTGRLADPSDLPFDAAHLDDEAALTAAIEGLLTRKPHLASRVPRGDVGQGATGEGQAVDLAGILRGLAS